MRLSTIRFASLVALPAIVIACNDGSGSPKPKAAHQESQNGHSGHHHDAPHGGTLVALGDHVGHVEFLLHPDDGTLTAYFFGPEAENSVRLSQESLSVAITTPDGETTSHELAAAESPLTGESVGDTSQFEATIEPLQGVSQFDALIASINFKGIEFTDVSFSYPDNKE